MASTPVPEFLHLTLSGKEHCPIAYTFTSLTDSHTKSASTILLVYVNGLGLPQVFWQPSIQLLKDKLASGNVAQNYTVCATTYDRYGQGASVPNDGKLLVPHTIEDSVADLHNFIAKVHSTHDLNSSATQIVLVAQSIGVPVARLYIQTHPSAVSAALFLDSNIANTDWISLLPDPDSPSFDKSTLPDDTTIEQLRWTRDNYRRFFHPSAPNMEKLDRSNISDLLPHADKPHLTGPNGDELILCVVGHDPETFAEESLKISTKGLTEAYIETAWRQYNEGLCKLSTKSKGVVKASGSGHFVQKDNPGCVADEVVALLDRLLS